MDSRRDASGSTSSRDNPTPKHDGGAASGTPHAAGGSPRRSRDVRDGKVALVVSGHRGLGRVVARRLAREGARVAVLYSDEHRDAVETRTLITREGGRCLLVSGNMQEPAFYDLAIDEIIQEWGRLDVVVGGASERPAPERLERMVAERLRDIFALDVFPMFYLTQAALPYLERGAAVITSAHVGADAGRAGSVGLAAATGAVLSFTRSLAGSLKERGVRVNAVALDAGRPPPRSRDDRGLPDELAFSYAFLALHAPATLTGHVVRIGSAVLERA